MHKRQPKAVWISSWIFMKCWKRWDSGICSRDVWQSVTGGGGQNWPKIAWRTLWTAPVGLCAYVRMYVRTYVYTSKCACVYVCMYERMHAWMYLCMHYVRMYVHKTPPWGPLWPCARPKPGYRRRVGGEVQIPPPWKID